MDITQEIAQIVKYCRAKSGLTQKQLADLAGVGKTVVYDIEKGKESIRLNTLVKIFGVLNIKMKFDSPFINLMQKENEKGESI
ncbi:MAG: helix-turn-helix transcriptional regulator [Ignavibacteriaceae bacterium]|nr:helix-turn-helix transcriptional regulator [Ignavibacteriaceae bacterium]